jgi:hypothetical protein
MSEIPRIIHQIWYQGEDQLPAKYQRYRESWRKHHPEWEHRFWDAPRMRELLRERYDWFLPYFDAYSKPIQRINSSRYFILHSHGGFHFDMDTRCVKPIDPLLQDYRLILSQTVGFNNAIIGSVPGHPLWPVAFDLLKQRHPSPPASGHAATTLTNRALTHSAGAMFFNDVVSQSGFDKDPGTRLCPGSYFEVGAPVLTDGVIVSNDDPSEAYAVHDMDLLWLSPLDRLKVSLSKPLFRLLVAFNGWRAGRVRHQ